MPEPLALIIIFTITRPFTTLFHELGHGIPAVLLTNEKVTLYLGSMGDPSKSLRFSIGRLELYFKYNPFLWNGGLCVAHSKYISVNRQIFYTLMGPLGSLICGALCCYIVFATNMHNDLKAIGVVFLASSLYDFVTNLIPRKRPIHLHDGTIAYNDGQSLKQLLRYKALPHKFHKGVTHCKAEEFSEAYTLFQEMIMNGSKNETVLRLAIATCMRTLDYTSAVEIHLMLEKQCTLNSDDCCNAGTALAQLENYDSALVCFQKSLDLNPDNHFALNNRGYSYNLLGDFDNAIADFDKAIEIEGEFAYGLANRGLAKMKSGQENEGLKDIKHSLKLDNKNSYAHRNLGIYFFDRNEFKEALPHFILAEKLDGNTHLIRQYLDDTTREISKSGFNPA